MPHGYHFYHVLANNLQGYFANAAFFQLYLTVSTVAILLQSVDFYCVLECSSVFFVFVFVFLFLLLLLVFVVAFLFDYHLISTTIFIFSNSLFFLSINVMISKFLANIADKSKAF